MGTGLMEVETPEPPVPVFASVGVGESPADRLRPSQAEIIRGLARELDAVADMAIGCATVEDFRAIKGQLFKSYVELSRALAHVMSSKLSKADLPPIAAATLSSLEDVFRAGAGSYVGEDACREILFSLGTLRSVYRWLPHLALTKVDEDKAQADGELSKNCFARVTATYFCLQALLRGITKERILSSDLLAEFLEGLRSSVMAYAYVREALDLRHVLDSRYKETLDVSWDAEDEALANAK